MVQSRPTTSATRLVATIPGVPVSQAQALDRRRRLNRQLHAFRATERAPEAATAPTLNELAVPGRA